VKLQLQSFVRSIKIAVLPIKTGGHSNQPFTLDPSQAPPLVS